MHNQSAVKQFVAHRFTLLEWGLGGFVLFVSLLAWASTHDFSNANAFGLYELFPLLGLLAFGLMWTHFVMGALRRYSAAKVVDKRPYQSISMGIVLALLLHPGLLWLGLYLDGLGLPPQSHITAYSSQLFAVSLGTLGLTIFLAFELKRWFGEKKWWRAVEYAQIIAMLAIFIHALQLGDELQLSWFAFLWWGYGLTMLAAIIYTYFVKREGDNNER